jgi:hypothetical protein
MELESIAPDYFEHLLQKQRPAAPVWPAPRLADMPMDLPALPHQPPLNVSLPTDPWNFER